MTRRLRIVHTESSCGWGGQEIRILNESEGMLARGHDLSLICCEQSPLHQEAMRRNLPVTALPIEKKRLPGMQAIGKWLRTQAPDIVNTHSSTDSWLSALACVPLRHAPVLVRTRHVSVPVPNNWPTRWLYQSATRHIVTTGEALRAQLIDNNRYDAARITSIPTGIDVARFVPGDRDAARRQLGLPLQARLVGCVGTMRHWKGHRYLIDAFAAMEDDNAHLLIVGDGPQRANLQQQIETLGLGARIHLPGNQADVVPWLQSMDLFVLPSYAHEGVPQALLQAMACALPVISTPIGGIPEVVHPERTGLLVKAADARELQLAMRRLLDQPAFASELGRRGRDQVVANNSFGAMLDRMEQLFQSLAPQQQHAAAA